MVSRRRAALLAMLIATLFWGGTFPVSKYLTGQMEPLLIAGLRLMIAGPILLLFLPRDQRRKLLRFSAMGRLLPLTITGILANQVCFMVGIQRTTPGHAAVIMAMIPIFVSLLARVFLRERLSVRAWLGVLIAAAGAVGVVLSAPGAERSATLLGDIFVLTGTLAFSVYIVLGRRLVREYGPRSATAGAFLGAVPFAPLLILLGLPHQDWSRVDPGGLAALAYVILFATLLTYSLFFWSLEHLSAVEAAVFANVQPVFATVLSALLGMDVLGPLFLAFAGAALLGVVLVQTSDSGKSPPD